jgi:carboxyl-terminal processing protease
MPMFFYKNSIAQTGEVQFLLDTTLHIFKEKSINTGEVNWAQLQKTVWNKASTVTDPYQLGPIIRYLYQSLNDYHGVFTYKDSVFRWNRQEKPVSDSIMNEWKKGIHIQTLLLSNHIGYLRVPYMSFAGLEGDSKNAQQLNDSLCSLFDKNIKGLILDLRLNGGGAMFPMILGLDQLFIPGQIGHFVTRKRINWYIKDNSFLLDTLLMAHINPKCVFNAHALPLVILIGRGTGSSGEFLAISLKSRKHTVYIGNETAGYITSTEGTQINADAHILLSAGYGADGNGTVYKKALKPDIMINSADKFNNLPDDEKVKLGINWINQQLK